MLPIGLPNAEYLKAEDVQEPNQLDNYMTIFTRKDTKKTKLHTSFVNFV